MSVVVNDITKKYGQQKAVDSVSFELKKGEIVGFIGPNGSGKSTTMKCICNILPPDSGTILIDGIDVQKNPLAIKKNIGYLPEHNPLYDDMYVKEYLVHIARYYLNKKETKKSVKEIIELTGLGAEQHKRIGQLSKGYKQRVGLAQALVHNPAILILDEPTTGLDPNQILEIRGLISGLSKDKTVLLSTHILQEVEAICDRVIIINKGKVAADSTTAIIRASEKENLQTIYVEFNLPADTSQLMEIGGIEKVQAVSTNAYFIAGRSEDDLRERIFTFAANNNLKLLTIQKKEETLEEAFRKLTT